MSLDYSWSLYRAELYKSYPPILWITSLIVHITGMKTSFITPSIHPHSHFLCLYEQQRLTDHNIISAYRASVCCATDDGSGFRGIATASLKVDCEEPFVVIGVDPTGDK